MRISFMVNEREKKVKTFRGGYRVAIPNTNISHVCIQHKCARAQILKNGKRYFVCTISGSNGIERMCARKWVCMRGKKGTRRALRPELESKGKKEIWKLVENFVAQVQGDFCEVGNAAVRFDLMRPCAFHRSYMT